VLITFPLLYALVLIVWPNFQGVRFLLPLLPFYVFYVIRGINGLSVLRVPVGAVGLLAVGVMYANFYAHAQYGPIVDGVFNATSQELFAYVKSQTNANDTFVFFKPRAFALFTDRAASAYHSPPTQDELLAYFQDIHARFVIVGAQDTEWAKRYIVADPAHFQAVWSNTAFTVFQARLDL